jgi:hypothetical protein
MKFQILARWPSEDILPVTVECESALATIREQRALIRSGLDVLEVMALEDGSAVRVSNYRLNKLSLVERSKEAKRSTRNVIAGALLGMVASALPNGFGDFGVVPGFVMLRMARVSRIGARRKPLGRSVNTTL